MFAAVLTDVMRRPIGSPGRQATPARRSGTRSFALDGREVRDELAAIEPTRPAPWAVLADLDLWAEWAPVWSPPSQSIGSDTDPDDEPPSLARPITASGAPRPRRKIAPREAAWYASHGFTKPCAKCGVPRCDPGGARVACDCLDAGEAWTRGDTGSRAKRPRSVPAESRVPRARDTAELRAVNARSHDDRRARLTSARDPEKPGRYRYDEPTEPEWCMAVAPPPAPTTSPLDAADQASPEFFRAVEIDRRLAGLSRLQRAVLHVLGTFGPYVLGGGVRPPEVDPKHNPEARPVGADRNWVRDERRRRARANRVRVHMEPGWREVLALVAWAVHPLPETIARRAEGPGGRAVLDALATLGEALAAGAGRALRTRPIRPQTDRDRAPGVQSGCGAATCRGRARDPFRGWSPPRVDALARAASRVEIVGGHPVRILSL